MMNKSSLLDFLSSSMTALANLTTDPALQHVPWLGDEPIAWSDLAVALKHSIEACLDAVKEQDLEQYLRLRDRYRLDVTVLRLIQEETKAGVF
jgi:hypothetical protein